MASDRDPATTDHAPAWVRHGDGRWYPGLRRSWFRARPPDGEPSDVGVDGLAWFAVADYHAPVPADEAGGVDGLTGHFYTTVPAGRIQPRDPDDPAPVGQPRAVT